MSKLSPLRSRLGQLRRRRQALRWGTAWCGWLALVGLLLIVLYLIDWQWEPDRSIRVVLLLALAAAAGWAYRARVWPWLGQREGEVELALLVERQQRIDSDLVAALQFEAPQANRWGSRQLETAVIDYVAEFSRELDVFQGLSTAALKRRAAALAAVAATAILFGLLYPEHLRTFTQRLLLSSLHYPTQTVLDAIVINHQVVYLRPGATANAALPGTSPRGGASAAESSSAGASSSEAASAGVRPAIGPPREVVVVRCAAWQPLTIEVECSGVVPQTGHVELRAIGQRAETDLPLVAGAEPPVVVAGATGRFRALLERLVDPVEYQIFLGDAWTDPVTIQVIPLPVVELQLQVTPPSYVGPDAGGEQTEGTRQIAVIEGSRVDLRLRSDKPLESATLAIGTVSLPFTRVGPTAGSRAPSPLASNLGGRTASPGEPDVWQIDASGTPLEHVVEPLRYEVQVVDTDGLGLREPLPGYVRIKADRPPRASAGLVTQFVLPTARPSISYGAADDYGLAQLRIIRQVVRQSGEMEEQTVEIPLSETSPKLVRGRWPVELESLRLVKGDQIKLTLEALDFRGPLPGKTALSEPLVLQVTDKPGVLAAMVESDERSARQLEAIIQRQLGIGESP